MEILLATHNFYPYHWGGTEVYVHHLAKYLMLQGHQVTIIAAVGDQAFIENPIIYSDKLLTICTYSYEGIKVWGIKYHLFSTEQIYSKESLRHQESWLSFLSSFDNSYEINILHVHGFTAAIGLDLLYAVQKKYSSIKTVCSYHTPISDPKESLTFGNTFTERKGKKNMLADVLSYKLNISYSITKFFSKLIPTFKLHDKLPSIFNFGYYTNLYVKAFSNLAAEVKEWWTYSEGTKNHLIEFGIAEDKVKFVRHGIAEIFINNKNVSKQPTKFLFNGRMVIRKGFGTLLTAWLALPENSDKELWLTADARSTNKRIQSLINLAKLRKDIKWLGEVDQLKLSKIYTQVDTVIIPSEWFEVGPLVFHEAVSSGCRVIASDIGGCKELAAFYPYQSETFKTGDYHDLMLKIINNLEHSKSSNPETKVMSFNEHFDQMINKSDIYG